MPSVLRLALVAGAVALGCAGLAGGGVAWLQDDAERAREARIATLHVELADVRMRETLTAADACALAEEHVLTRTIDRALAVTCNTPEFAGRGERAGRLTGFVYGSGLQNALFGGGHAQPLCLARSASGWAVVGDDFRLPDCAIDVAENAQDAGSITRAATADESDRKRMIALATMDAVRTAIAFGAPTPDTCESLRPPTPGFVTTLSDATLAGRPATGIARHFGYGMAGCVTPESGDALDSLCGLAEPATLVLLFDSVAEDPPRMSDSDTFTGGTWSATLRLIDVDATRVVCARPVAFALPDSVLTVNHNPVTTEYDRGVKRAICEGVATLGAGGLRLDPWWGCAG